MALSENTRVVVLVVPRALVKTVKSVLEERGWFGGQIAKIGRGGNVSGSGGGAAEDVPGEFRILTRLQLDRDGTADEDVLGLLGLGAYAGRIWAAFEMPGGPGPGAAAATATRNPLDSAISAFLQAHPAVCPPDAVAALRASAPRRWSLYPPLALLPPTAFSSPAWSALLSALSPALQSALYSAIAHALGATHLAINAPIPSGSALRSPSGLVPLHGDFGPPLPPTTTAPPTPADLASAFWCRCRQNGILQTWAPRYTMFSRGNVKEKARVRGALPDVAGQTVVDLYAGIGYFAFSYVAAGARRAWCWELNPWSCEALVRGARANGWGVRLVRGGESVGEGVLEEEECRLVVFMEDNGAAEERLRALRVRARHVNLGLLPTSRGSWRAALGIVDRGEGGWVHVHENIAEGAIAEGAAEVVRRFEDMAGARGDGAWTIACAHVEQVKTFAPGVMHCVLDLHIGGGN